MSATVAMVVRNAVQHDARVLREARALAAVGYRVVIFGERRKGTEPGTDLGAVRIERVEPRGALLWVITKFSLGLKRLGLGWARRAVEPARAAAKAYAFQVTAGKHMAALKPAAYHCHDYNTMWAGRVARRRHRAPVVYDAHDIYLHQALPRFTRRRKIMIALTERAMIRRADAVIAANGSYADLLSSLYGVARPLVVRNIPEVTGPVAPPRSAGYGPPVILYLGGIVAGRGIATAIRALAELPGARLRCVGPAVRRSYVEEYEALAASLGVADRVTFEQPVPPEQVTAVAAEATIGLALTENVSLSNYLQLPNKLFECIHAGLPMVGSAFPEIGGLIERYGFGLTCDPSDPSSVAAAARKILDDPGLAAQMRGRALEAAAENTWARESQVLTDLYARLAPNRVG